MSDTQPTQSADTVRGADLLNDFTKAVLAEAAEVAATLPEGYEMSVSAHSDAVLAHLGSGQWIGFEMRGIKPEKRRWKPWRGSLFVDDWTVYPSLAEAVAALIAFPPGHDFKPGTSVDGGPPSDLWCDVCGESRAKAHPALIDGDACE